MTQTTTEYRHELTDEAVTSDGEGPATHIVWLPPELRSVTTAQAYIMEARIEGREVEALCGYRWVPQRDPKQYPICSKCIDIYKGHDHPSRDRLPEA